MKGIEIKILRGSEAEIYTDQILNLQLSLFKKFPYLYNDSKEETLGYLSPYFKSSNSILILFFDRKELVGFSSSIPLSESFEDIQELFLANNLDINQYLYVGTITLSETIRNWHLVYIIMKTHYKTANSLGLSCLTAITVDRPDNHPLKPLNYRSLDKLWQRFGWNKHPSLKLASSWIQTDTNLKEDNILSVWTHPLSEAKK